MCSGADTVHGVRPYLDRNRDIARACSVLIALPETLVEVQRSGSWATVRYAREYGKEVLLA